MDNPKLRRENLIELSLDSESNIKIDDIMKLANIEVLCLNAYQNIVDEEISKLTNLSVLFLKNSLITDNGISHLINLDRLELYWDGLITDNGIRNLTNLTFLKLESVSKITDNGISYLTKLEIFEFIGFPITSIQTITTDKSTYP